MNIRSAVLSDGLLDREEMTEVLPALLDAFLDRRGDATRMAVRLDAATVIYLELVDCSEERCEVRMYLEEEYVARWGIQWANVRPWPLNP